MTRLLFDTTFIIDAERTGDELDAVIDNDDDIAIAAVTIAELRVGALVATRRRKAARSSYVEDIIATIPVLAYDLEVAEAHAELLVEVRSQGGDRESFRSHHHQRGPNRIPRPSGRRGSVARMRLWAKLV